MKKRLMFIRPNMGDYRAKDAMTPLSIGILSALTPNSYEVSFYDDRIEEIPFEQSVDIVALSVETFTAKRSYQIAKIFRDRGVVVVMGGYHPSLLPEEALNHCDAVVVGDAEGVWQILLEDFEKDSLKEIYRSDNSRNLEDFKIDREIFRDKKYLPVELVQFGRGCRYSCDFCSIESFYKSSVRSRVVESVVAEIKKLNKKRLIFFVDDNILNSKRGFIELLDALIPLGIKWACQISIDVAGDKSLLDKMAKSGCKFVLIGFESLIKENLKQMNKGWNSKFGDYKEVIDEFHKRGIAVYGTFVFGYDYDDTKSIKNALDFALKAKLEVANFNPLTPTPKTKLYDRLKRENRLLYDKWWLEPNYRYGDAIFSPKRMSEDEFAKGCYEARIGFYSFSSIVKRTLFSDLRFNISQFFTILMINIISNIEIKNKQKRVIGK